MEGTRDAVGPTIAVCIVLAVVIGIAWGLSDSPKEKAQTAVYDACLAGEWGRCRQCAIEDPSRDRRAACVTLLLFDKRREE